jgi:hypothetical protein
MMLLTEDEARRRWCPFARSLAMLRSAPVAVNRHGDSLVPGSYCIGSACMAWRTAETPELTLADDAFLKRSKRRVANTGFCGLAGRTP